MEGVLGRGQSGSGVHVAADGGRDHAPSRQDLPPVAGVASQGIGGAGDGAGDAFPSRAGDRGEPAEGDESRGSPARGPDRLRRGGEVQGAGPGRARGPPTGRRGPGLRLRGPVIQTAPCVLLGHCIGFRPRYWGEHNHLQHRRWCGAQAASLPGTAPSRCSLANRPRAARKSQSFVPCVCAPILTWVSRVPGLARAKHRILEPRCLSVVDVHRHW